MLPNVLIVDDDELTRRSMARLIATGPYRIGVASDGEAALAELMTHRYDIVITDVRMPELGGVDLLRHVRDLDPAMPVKGMTGHPELSAATDAVNFGALRYLKKPVPSHQLWAALQHAVELRKTAQREALLTARSRVRLTLDDLEALLVSATQAAAAAHPWTDDQIEAVVQFQTHLLEETKRREYDNDE